MAAHSMVTAAEGRKFLAIGPGAWGQAPTPEQAVKLAKQNIPWSYVEGTSGPIHVYDVPEDAVVTELGTFSYAGAEDHRELPPVMARRPRGR